MSVPNTDNETVAKIAIAHWMVEKSLVYFGNGFGKGEKDLELVINLFRQAYEATDEIIGGKQAQGT